jgi:hypothetical protein
MKWIGIICGLFGILVSAFAIYNEANLEEISVSTVNVENKIESLDNIEYLKNRVDEVHNKIDNEKY